MRRIVFCDFDGTITAQETFVAVLKEFAPELAAELIPQMYALKITLREGVRRILESIPSSRLPEIIEFTRNQPMREGLPELLDFLDSQDIPFVVASGGLREMVEAVMGDLVQRVKAIHAIDIDTSISHFQVISPYEGETELVDKVKVMEMYPADVKIAIGDSVTDLNMALSTPLVFARDRLAQYLSDRNKSYIAWNDFFDVLHALKSKI
ncbi:HAD-IB family phosphatase [Calothrix sp. UHCC 0171]|uniref:HAD-IB family phosphatase n=1 Tax=Calothrix sp. UHCC 0171 TaxID=3110245 RepID=UPI002B20E60F|nr:HAD-IB family phosphatase [Calothrix sp. UHCC 0171]MEA5571177.1 HAD-IB family phosphatase [Calothrix sp. UHCC 0171]